MPSTDVVYFLDSNGSVPVLKWIRELAGRDRRAAAKCIAQIDVLRQFGSELRRPTVDFLRDGIYELRLRVGRSQHRVLYFFHGRNIVVLVHALTKEDSVPVKNSTGAH
jgi:phage-related protein